MLTGKGLAKLIEECGELIQVAGKKLAFYTTDVHPDGGPSPSLKRRMEDEIKALEEIRVSPGVLEVEPPARLVWVGSHCLIVSLVENEDGQGYQVGDSEPCVLCDSDRCVAQVEDWGVAQIVRKI